MIDSWFGVHPHVIRSGLWARLKPGEKDLYLFLMAESERCCTRELKRADAEIRKVVGLAPRTSCNARKRLQESGLIRCSRGDGNKYVYTICDPRTGQPYPGDPRTPMVMPKRGMEKRRQAHATSSLLVIKANGDQEVDQNSLETYGLPSVFEN